MPLDIPLITQLGCVTCFGQCDNSNMMQANTQVLGQILCCCFWKHCAHHPVNMASENMWTSYLHYSSQQPRDTHVSEVILD